MPKPKPKSKRKSKLVWRIKQNPAPPPPPPPWIELPGEITADILQRLGTIEILENVQRVCSTWRKVCNEYPSIWRVIDMRNDNVAYDDDDEEEEEISLGKMCRVAVDRSQGQLVKINIEGFGDDDLLHYIAQRSSKLRHLRLVGCSEISGEGLATAAKNFPLLEELDIYFSNDISNLTIEGVGRSCTQLRSFTLNHSFRGLLSNNNEQALAIAGNLPELRRLALFGNRLSSEGLCAILDGCPRLESLDLRHCCNIDLRGDVGKRCRQQIMDLKCPDDSTSDYEFRARAMMNDFFGSDDEYPSGLSEGLSYYYHDYDEFDSDDFTNPFSSEYLDEDGFFF